MRFLFIRMHETHIRNIIEVAMLNASEFWRPRMNPREQF